MLLRALFAKLFARPEAEEVRLDEEDEDRLRAAAESAASISYERFASNVVAYLEPTHAELCEERSSWQAMQEAVISRLSAS